MRKIILQPEKTPFHLERTLECGQVFTWTRTGETWKGMIDGEVVTLRQSGSVISFNGITRKKLIHYLNLDQDLPGVLGAIRLSISNSHAGIPDPVFEAAATFASGLRIIRQDPWECLICFICSQNSNIPAITKRIHALCKKYGEPGQDGQYTFPTPAALSRESPESLRLCSTGYRAEYLSATARVILTDPMFLPRIRALPYSDAKKEIMQLPGVGPKVADCVLLFGFGFYEAVPVDVWIRSIITSRYPEVDLCKGKKQSCSYDDIADWCRLYFGLYAGYAQQVLFASRTCLPEICLMEK